MYINNFERHLFFGNVIDKQSAYSLSFIDSRGHSLHYIHTYHFILIHPLQIFIQ